MVAPAELNDRAKPTDGESWLIGKEPDGAMHFAFYEVDGADKVVATTKFAIAHNYGGRRAIFAPT